MIILKMSWAGISIGLGGLLLIFIFFSEPSKINMFNVFKLLSAYLLLNGFFIFTHIGIGILKK